MTEYQRELSPLLQRLVNTQARLLRLAEARKWLGRENEMTLKDMSNIIDEMVVKDKRIRREDNQ